MNPSNYFPIADEYVSLQKIFSRDTLLQKLELWIDDWNDDLGVENSRYVSTNVFTEMCSTLERLVSNERVAN
jgi:transcriptional regulatory protein LevR